MTTSLLVALGVYLLVVVVCMGIVLSGWHSGDVSEDAATGYMMIILTWPISLAVGIAVVVAMWLRNLWEMIPWQR